MAQYFYSASDANILDNLTKIRGNGTVSVVSDLSDDSLEFLLGSNDTIFTINTVPAGGSFEFVYLRRTEQNNTGAQLGMGKYMATELTLSAIGYSAGTGIIRSNGGSRSTLGIINNLVADQLAYHYTRVQVTDNGDGTTTTRVRCWDVGDTEPTGWAITRTDSTATHQVAGIPCFYNDVTTTNYVRWFGVGTNGDPAPTAPVGPTDPQLPVNIEQTPEVASSLSIAGTIFTPLSATIEQQARVRGFSNELENLLYGIYNPGTEADGPLDWPYVYSPTQNEVVLQGGRFVGTTDLPATNSYMELPLAEISTGPITDYNVTGKTYSRAETRFQGLRLGLTDSVSGAYVYVEVWDKNWYLEFYDGASNGGSDTGTLEFAVNDVSLAYSVNTGRFLLYLNNSGASNSLEQFGLSFDSAFYQVNNGGESVSWFEELGTATLPSAYSPATVYIPGSDSAIESGTEATASLQVGTGRRLAATVEQGSELLATARQALPLASVMAQGSSLATNLRQGLSLTSTLAQGSDFQSNLILGLPLAATVAQDSSLLATATLGLPLAATSETQTQVLGSAIVALSLSSTIETGASLQGPLRLGSGLQATLSQASDLQASLGLGLRLSGSASQGSTVLAQMATGVRLSGLVAQASSLDGTARIGAGLVADIYTDSAVSAALGVGVRLSGTVGQPNAAMAITGPRIGLPLYATVATPTTTTASLQKQTGLALGATLEQGSALPAALSGGTTGGSSAIIVQTSEAVVQLRAPVPLAPSLVEQESQTTVSLSVSIPLGAASIQTQPEFTSILKGSQRLFIILEQESELALGELETGKRFYTTIEQGTHVSLSSGRLGMVGKLSTEFATRPELDATLKLSVRLGATSTQESTVLSDSLLLTKSLEVINLEQGSRLYLSLRVPALGSTGWLTVSDIVFHNDYYSEVVFERLPASEIAIMPAVRLDSLSIKPE